MNLANVMDELAAQLSTITGLRAYAWPVETINPPAVIVSYPDTYTFDGAYNRGNDVMTIPIVVLVGRVNARSARDAVGDYVNGSGTSSIKATIEAGTYTAFDTVRVTKVDFDIYTLASVNYLAAIFELDVAGPGS